MIKFIRNKGSARLPECFEAMIGRVNHVIVIHIADHDAVLRALRPIPKEMAMLFETVMCIWRDDVGKKGREA